jgi:hypothetical protein
MQCPPTINPLPTKLSSNILDGEFNNNILDTIGRGVCLGNLFELSDVHVMSRDSARALCIYLSGHRAPNTSSS